MANITTHLDESLSVWFGMESVGSIKPDHCVINLNKEDSIELYCSEEHLTELRDKIDQSIVELYKSKIKTMKQSIAQQKKQLTRNDLNDSLRQFYIGAIAETEERIREIEVKYSITSVTDN